MADDEELTMERRMTKVESFQQNHEQVCAQRWGLLIKLISWGGGLAFATAIGLASWGLSELYTSQQQELKLVQGIVDQQR